MYMPPEYSLEFDFDGFILNIPFSMLLVPVPGIAPDEFCALGIFSIDELEEESRSFSYVLGGAFFRSAYVIMDPALGSTAIAISNPNITTQDIFRVGYGDPAFIDLKGNVPQKTEDITGQPSPTSTYTLVPTPESSESPVAVIVGSTIGGVAFLVATIGGIFLYRRIKNLPQPPDVEPYYPTELASVMKYPPPPAELNNDSVQELPSSNSVTALSSTLTMMGKDMSRPSVPELGDPEKRS
ncbi:hypothetical protein ABW19_dt0204787 [Dactylella cylindrospora]|nr:hypothetical protein ABW19_dt0204787 [Dactylella cylindrospora]